MALVSGTDNSERIDRAYGVTDEFDFILGYGGDDTIFGFGGDDYIAGGAGADTIDGGSGIDTASYFDSGEGVAVSLSGGQAIGGTAEDDVLISIENLRGSNYDDVLVGDASANVIEGSLGNDTIKGAGGDDELIGGAGADRIDGGAGIDTAIYSSSNSGVVVNLSTGLGTGGHAEGDVLSGIENLEGSQYNDTLTGDASANELFGLDGDDLLIGASGNDLLRGGSGADRIDGGAGIDTADYLNSPQGVTVALALGESGFGEGAGGDAEGDRLSSIENVNGSVLSDHLIGDDVANVLNGRQGNDTIKGAGGDDTLLGGFGRDVLDGGVGADTLNGGAGADTLLGGPGADTLAGGEGADTFVWLSAAETGATLTTADTVNDFDHSAGDLLDLSSIDADVMLSGNQDFTFIGTDDFGAPGQVRWFTEGGQTYIALNTDADSSAEAIIELLGLQTVEESWFVL